MNSDWIPTRFGEVAHVVHGWAFKGESFVPASDTEDLPAVVSIGNFDYSGGFRFENSSLKYYSGEYPAEYELGPQDLLLVMTCQTEGGEILGVPGLIPDDGRRYLHNQRLGRVEIDHPEQFDKNFAFQLARTAEFNRQLFVTASGSKILHTSPTRIEATLFGRPPLWEQRAIAEVLGVLDDKIAANTKLAATADEFLAAQLSSSLREDHDVVPLATVATVNQVTVKPERGGQVRYIDIAAVGVGVHEVPALIPWEDAPSRARRKVSRGDTLWSTVRPNRRSHSLNLSDDPSLVGSTGLAVITPTTVGFAYLYEVTKLPEFTSYLETVAEGSAYPAVRADRFGEAQVPLLRESARHGFEALAAPMREHIHALGDENRTLAANRDALLPQLMSGALRVKDAEKVLEGVL